MADSGILRRVVFLDRDGVINRDSPDYITGEAAFEFLPGSCEAIGRLTANGCSVVVVTNQSALGRGWLTAEGLAAIHARLAAGVREHGGRIHDILVCPHRPDEACGCRKPRPGLIAEARRRHAIDLSAAVMVGDSVRDIECGRNAGVGTVVLVRTGNGLQAEAELGRRGPPPDFIAEDLSKAVDWILRRSAA